LFDAFIVTCHRVMPSRSIVMLPHRTTFSLDQATVDGIRELAKIWDTTQAGAVRRAIEEAASPTGTPAPVRFALQAYTTNAGNKTTAQKQNCAMTQARKHIVSIDHAGTYHCVSRCVRRSWLCGWERNILEGTY